MPATKRTTDHQEIKRWVESHGGHPATVKRTRSNRDVGLIRVDFPGFSGEDSLEPISWDEWFSKFDAQGLAFLYQSGKATNFNKLVRRDPDEMRPSDQPTSRSVRAGRVRGGRPKRAASARGRRNASAGARSQKKSGRVTRQVASSPRQRSAGTQKRGQDLEHWTKAELYSRAKRAGVPQRSSMNKAELVRALQSGG